MHKRGLSVVGALAIAIGIFAAGAPAAMRTSSGSVGAAKLTNVTIQFTFKTRGENAFLYLAAAKGYFKKQGINVKFQEGVGAGPVFASQAIENGNIFVVGIANQAAVAINAGLPLHIVGTWEPETVSVLVSKKPLNSPKDLIGLTVGLKQGQNASLTFPHFMQANGLDPSKVNVKLLDSSAANAVFLQGGVDVVDAFTTNEVPILEAACSCTLNVMHLTQWGFPDLGLSLIVKRSIESTKAGQSLIRRFLVAAGQGIAATKVNPQAAAEAIKAQYGALLPDTSVILKQVQNANIAMPKQGKHMYGWADPARWKAAIDTAHKTGVIVDPPDRSPLPVSYYYTNKYVK